MSLLGRLIHDVDEQDDDLGYRRPPSVPWGTQPKPLLSDQITFTELPRDRLHVS